MRSMPRLAPVAACLLLSTALVQRAAGQFNPLPALPPGNAAGNGAGNGAGAGSLPGAGSGAGASSLPPAPGAGPSIPVEVKDATNAAPFRGQIRSFIQSQVQDITSDDPDAQKDARQKLISECNADATPSYLGIFAQEVSNAVLPILNRPKLPPLRVRLNLAVMVEGIAHNSRDAVLQPVVEKLMDDPTEPVAIWGLRAAKPVLGTLVARGAAGSTTLGQHIVAAAKAHVRSGNIAEEGYRALSLDGEPINLSSYPAAVVALANSVLNLLDWRISLYTTTLPDDPHAEDFPCRWFALDTIYHALTPQQQASVVQSLVNLLTLIGERAVVAPPLRLQQVDLGSPVQTAAETLMVITQEPQTSALGNATHYVPGANPQVLRDRTTPIYAELKPRYPFLRPPPALAPATAPSRTTAPSTPSMTATNPGPTAAR